MTDVAPEEEFVELDGGRVHLLRGGTGEPVLFLHAAGGAGSWLPFHEMLAARGFEVIAPDHPGFGKSDEFPEVEAIDDLVFHYLDVLDALGLDRPHVVGASFGGWIAAETNKWLKVRPTHWWVWPSPVLRTKIKSSMTCTRLHSAHPRDLLLIVALH